MNVLGEFVRYLLVHLLPVSYYTNKSKKKRIEENVFVSFTSIPSRIDGIKPTVNALLDQSKRPSCIYIHVPGNEQSTHIPEFIQNNPLIKINWIENDLGPATKFIPMINLVPKDALIIVLDDDQVYPKRLVETYLHFENQMPDAGFCQVGWKVPKTLDHANRTQRFGAKFRLVGQENPVKEPVEVEVIQGASSYALKPKFFDAEVSDYVKAPKEARFVDDIWFSGLLAKRGVKKYVVPGFFKFCRLSNWKIAAGTGLVKTANKAHTNNNRLYEYFKDSWKLYD